MTELDQRQLGNTLWGIADQLRGAMNADDFRDYMLSFLFLRYLSDNYEPAAQKELGPDYPKLDAGDRRTPLAVWYAQNQEDTTEFEKQMRRKTHYVIQPAHLCGSIAEMARTQPPHQTSAPWPGSSHAACPSRWSACRRDKSRTRNPSPRAAACSCAPGCRW